jgi:ribulose-5-phosphate 4-epimerase/fuculose-1-phosphate aldolase
MNLELKNNLVKAYKILAYLKLDDHTYTHLSIRSKDQDSYYIYPFGLRFDEVEESLLLKVNFNGQIIEGAEKDYNPTGYLTHSSIYKNRLDIQAIFHLHTPAIAAVSALEEGLMPISQWALHFYGQLAYHSYNSLILEGVQGFRLVKDLGSSFVMLMQHHGALICGRTIQEAMFYTYHLEQACKTQCLTLSMQRPFSVPSKETCEQAVHDLLGFEKDLGMRDWKAWVRLIEKI